MQNMRQRHQVNRAKSPTKTPAWPDRPPPDDALRNARVHARSRLPSAGECRQQSRQRGLQKQLQGGGGLVWQSCA